MSEDKPTKSWNLFWPKIESPGDAEKAIKGAAGICAFVAVMGFLLSLAYKYGVLQIPAAKDSWYNVFTYGPLAYFIYEKSKTAVWLALGLYLVDRRLVQKVRWTLRKESLLGADFLESAPFHFQNIPLTHT